MNTPGKILALDLGVVTGFCLGAPGERPVSGSKILRAPHEDSDVGLACLLNWLNQWWLKEKPVLVVKEAKLSYAGFARSNSSALVMDSQTELHGVVKGLSKMFSIRWVDVSRSTVMKHFVGRGDLNRKEGKLAALERCRLLGYIEKFSKEEDRADSCALWDYAVHEFGVPTKARHQLAMFQEASA